MFKKKLCTAWVSCLLASQSAYAQESDDLLGELSLEELFSISTDIASNVERSIFEQPSIISVISREQILNSGARDLLDVMRMVPGFGFAHDTAGINSWGFRGIWGHEGKIMLMIDGAPYNDPAWGNLQFGRHYPTELISKVEIIRGPGAAKFGNYAELAVVRVTTVGQELEGGFVDTNVRMMENNFGSAEISAAYGGKTEGDLGYSLLMHSKTSNRTVTDFRSVDGALVSDQDNSPMRVFFADAKLDYKGFSLKSTVENYSFEHSDSLLQVPMEGTVVDQSYGRFHLGADYVTDLTDSLTLDSSVLYQEVTSHDMNVKSTDFYQFTGSHYRIDTDRIIASVDALYQLSENDSISVGVEYFEVNAKSRNTGDYFVDPDLSLYDGDGSDFAPYWFAGTDSMTFSQKSAFVQYENYNDIVNFTIGARFADHSASTETVLVPRIGLSKSWGDFGIKAMYSEAFRTGDAEHLNLAATPLRPEKLDSTEIEFHYLHKSGMYTLNFFQMNLEDAITWNTDALTANEGEIVSDGIEASWSSKQEKYDQEFTISMYKGDENSLPSQLAVDGESYLGFPTFKATWQMDYRVSENLVLHPSIMYEGEKYWRADAGDISKDRKVGASFLVNLNVSYNYSENLTFNASIHDAFNQGYEFPMAYGQVLYPGDSREISVGALYKF